jgi:hypothetical protein
VDLGLLKQEKRVGMQQQRELTRNPYKKDGRARNLGLVFAVAALFCLLFWANKKVRSIFPVGKSVSIDKIHEINI